MMRRSLLTLVLLSAAACSDPDTSSMQPSSSEEEEDAGSWCPPIEMPDEDEPDASARADAAPAESDAAPEMEPEKAAEEPDTEKPDTEEPAEEPAPDASSASMPEPAAEADAVSRGAALAAQNACTSCHQENWAGNGFFPNITPDPETGIGKWSDGQIEQAIASGTGADGAKLCNLMQRFELTTTELSDLVAFLRSLEPVENRITAVCPGHGM
jgi:hypothetical protein